MEYERNTKKHITFSVPGTDMVIPATLICGSAPGKTITISAGVHSREYIGIEAVIRLAQELVPEMVQGRILLLHCCNYAGFISRSPDVVPFDGKNLNRSFPGEKNGTHTQRLAAFLEAEIIRDTDYLVDLHSGGFCEALTPHAYFQGTAEPRVCEISRQIAELTSAAYLVRSTVTNGFYSYAGQCGVPAIILERGGSGLLHEDEVLADMADVKNILRGFGFLTDIPAAQNVHNIILSGYYVNSAVSGCWYPEKRPGDRIRKGEIVGEVRDIYGLLVCSVFAEAGGVILYQTISLGVEKGKPLIAYGELTGEG